MKTELINSQICNNLREIKESISEMKKEIDEIKQDCSKMNNHINFVDRIYKNVEKPFTYICFQANKILGKNEIENEKDFDE